MIHSEASQDSLDPTAFVTVDLATGPNTSNAPSNSDPTMSTQYHVTMEDGEDTDTGIVYFRVSLYNIY